MRSGLVRTTAAIQVSTAVLVAMVVLMLVGPAAAADDPLQETYDIFTVDFVLHNGGGGDWQDVGIAEGTTTSLSEYDVDSVDTTHQIVITGRDGQELWSHDLRINFEVHPYGGEPYERDNRTFYWRIPYFKEAQSITVYEFAEPDNPDTRNPVFTVNLEEEFCDLDGSCPGFCDGKHIDVDCSCGDGTCQEHENQELCSTDCRPGQTGGGVTDVNAVENENGIDIRFIAMLVIVLGLIGMLLVYSWKHMEIEGTDDERE